MKISIQEAYKIAQKALPDCKLNVEVKLNGRYSSEPKIEWEIWAEKEKGVTAIERDEIFSIALTKIVAELTRIEAKPVDDVIIDEEQVPNKDEPKKDNDSTTF